MKKILTVRQATNLAKELNKENKKIVLVGGCFDILHVGHVLFLEKAKEKGDVLFVWIESDETIRKSKGKLRPIHIQKERATVVAALYCVDYVVSLPHFTDNKHYDNLVKMIKPAIIAATKGDPEIIHKKRSAKLVGATVSYVTKRVNNASTSHLAQRIQQEEQL
ncbi:MAG TPA: adenylyltransferase/cytidyltransferase family protein [Candidatus Saccharimonadales bacterium]|nr:adenylyltransferase/cytidyltransferase family protein [Candidatus Saccharimonadales bacterium]